MDIDNTYREGRLRSLIPMDLSSQRAAVIQMLLLMGIPHAAAERVRERGAKRRGGE